MVSFKSPRICLLPHLTGIGGMASFQSKLAQGLSARGIEVVYHLQDTPYASVLVIGGMRDLLGLGLARQQGVPVIQRLNGMNWIHRRRRTGLRHAVRAEANNLVLQFIRRRVATRIVYQSEFARSWWERVHGPAPAPASSSPAIPRPNFWQQ